MNKSNLDAGVPWIWVTGGALATILVMILALMGLIVSNGMAALWPKSIEQVVVDGQNLWGIEFRRIKDDEGATKVLLFQTIKSY